MLSRVGSGLVGFDDLLHQTVAHHIFFSEVALRDAVHALENLKCIHKAAAGAVGQVDLSDVAGNDYFRADAMRVRNIFICSGVVFCASSRMMKESSSVRPRI